MADDKTKVDVYPTVTINELHINRSVPEFNKNIVKLDKKGGEFLDCLRNLVCPKCKTKVDIWDFRSSESLGLFESTGMCQKCQDKAKKEKIGRCFYCNARPTFSSTEKKSWSCGTISHHHVPENGMPELNETSRSEYCILRSDLNLLFTLWETGEDDLGMFEKKLKKIKNKIRRE